MILFYGRCQETYIRAWPVRTWDILSSKYSMVFVFVPVFVIGHSELEPSFRQRRSHSSLKPCRAILRSFIISCVILALIITLSRMFSSLSSSLKIGDQSITSDWDNRLLLPAPGHYWPPLAPLSSEHKRFIFLKQKSRGFWKQVSRPLLFILRKNWDRIFLCHNVKS